mmetsp:Transcript_13037/g.16904  ORF Transcript_13037/g.16904 Transcript_13037/m.16904 type:complete len:642 (-) Transcript_13037:132-2057(-)
MTERTFGSRDWGASTAPSWAASAVPDLKNPSNSLVSLLPKEIASNNLPKKIPVFSKHHDLRVRRWQSKKPPDSKGTFAQTNQGYTKSLRNAPDQSIINYHRDLRIAALVRQSVKEQGKNKKAQQTGGAEAEAAELRAMSIRQRFAKRNFHQWGSAVLKAVLEGDKYALEIALNAEGVDVDEIVVDAVFDDDEEEDGQTGGKGDVSTKGGADDSLVDSDSDQETETTAPQKKQGKFGNFIFDRVGTDVAVIAGHVRKLQLGLRCPNPTSRQFKEVTTKVRHHAQHKNKKLAAQAQAALLAAQAASVDGATAASTTLNGGNGGNGSANNSIPSSPILPTSPIIVTNQKDGQTTSFKTESQAAFYEANNKEDGGGEGNGGGGGMTSPLPLLQTAGSFTEETTTTMLLPSPRAQAAAIRILEDKARWKLLVPHLADCDYYIPPITNKINVFDQSQISNENKEKNNNDNNNMKPSNGGGGQYGLNGGSLDQSSLSSGDEMTEGDHEHNDEQFSPNEKIGLFICRGDTLLHIILRNVHVGYGNPGGLHALAEIALKRGCSWAVRNDKGQRPCDISAQPAGDKGWGASYQHAVGSVSTATGSVSFGPSRTPGAREIARRRTIQQGKLESGVLVHPRPRGQLKWFQPSG